MDQFSVIQSLNCTPFIFLDSLLCEKCFEIFLDLFSTDSNGWGDGSAGSLGLFSGISIWALGIVWVSSHSFRVRIIHCFFCWTPYSMRNVLITFEICSQLDQPVMELDHLVY